MIRGDAAPKGGRSVSVRKRWILVAATVGLGLGWLACVTMHHHPDDEMFLISEAIRTLFIVAAVSSVLACLVTPMAAVLQLGRQIGRAEHKRECGCHGDDPESYARVVPLKPPCRN